MSRFKTSINIKTDFSSISDECLNKINRLVDEDFLKPLRKHGWRKGMYLAFHPTSLMTALHYEMQARSRKPRDKEMRK